MHEPARRGDAADGGESEVDALLALLTHELSTPVTVIGGYAETLADRLGDDHGIAAIRRNVENLHRLIARLAEARDGVAVGEREHADLGGLVRSACRATSERVRVTTPDQAVVVDADPPALGRAIAELVQNARQYGDSDQPIDVIVEASSDDATVRVIDHGPGIPPARADEVFGRFARLDARGRGLGLGLFLARAIARAHGGDVTYEPTPGGGATFALTIGRVRGDG